MNSTPIKIASLFFLILATFLAFSPALDNGFTNWDDEELLTENLLVRDISWGKAKKIFSSAQAGTYIPLTIISYSLEQRLWGLNPKGYHAVNLAVHSLNACLVLLLLYLLGAGWWPALAAALLWAVHPLRVESVVWVTERKDVLYVWFYLSSLLSYLRYLQNKRRGYYLLSFFLFVASGLSKGVAVTLPVALLLIDYLFASRPAKRIWLEKIPFFAAAAGLALAGFWAQRPGGFNPEHHSYGLGQKALIACHNLVFYLGKTVWPAKLSALYPYPNNGNGTLPWTFWAAPLAVAAVLFAAAAMARRSPAAGWGAWFFLITIAPLLQLVKLLGPAMAAERYTYLPSVGLAFMLALGLGKAEEYFSGRNRYWRPVLGICLLVVSAVLNVLSWQRSKVWESSLTLWNDVIAKHPQVAVAYNNRGKYFAFQGQQDLALNDYNTALGLQPSYVTALGNRALLFIQSGEYGLAITDLDRAIAINPLETRNINNRGALAVKQGDFQQALLFLNTALELNPNYSDAYYNRGLLFFALKDYNKSLKDLTEALRIDTHYTKAYLKRARLYLDLAQPENAIKDAEKAVSLDPGSAAAYNIIGLTYAMKGEYDRSLSAFYRALEIKPEFAETYNNLAMLYYARQDYNESWAYLQKAQGLGYKSDANLIKDIKEKLK